MVDEPAVARAVGRRVFLTRVAWLVASTGAVPMTAGSAGAAPTPFPAVDAFVLDTVRGLCAMVFPGPDDWSRSQGTPRIGPSAIEIGGGEFMVDLFDNYLAAGDQLARPLALAFGQALDELGVPAPPFVGLTPEQGQTFDQALGYAYSDRILPLSALVALVLNFGSLLIAPQTIVGPLGSPFARLSLREKCRVLELIELPIPELVSIVDRGLPGPLRGSGTGFLRFAGGLLLEASAFGLYSEMEMFDPLSRTVVTRPPGWDITGFRPDGLVDGHAELIGYYQGRAEVAADA